MSSARTVSTDSSGSTGGPGTWDLLLLDRLPAYRVLNNQELVRIIVGFLAGVRKRNLFLAITLNHSFFHACSDALWKSMRSLSPYLRLLPETYDGSYTQSKIITRAVTVDPWSRFSFYSPKTVSITLVNDPGIDEIMPTHWFNLLFGLPSSPSILFPKLTELSIKSLRGVNSIIPYHVAPNLRSVTISDFSAAGEYDPLVQQEITSLVASFMFNSPNLSRMVLQSPFTESMLYPLSRFPSLESASFVVPTPFQIRYLGTLNYMTQLRSVRLSACGRIDRAGYPEAGTHLNRFHPEQGKSNITSLSIVGDNGFTFKSTAFLASPSLRTFSARFLKGSGDNRGDDGVYIALLILHRLSHKAPNIQRICFERDDPELIPVGHRVAWYESLQAALTPEDIIPDLAKLRNLTFLSFKFIPFVDRTFTVRLVEGLASLSQLQTLCLLPLPLSHDERHKLTLPSLECLRTLASTNPALQHLTISIDMSIIPSEIPDLLLPGHSLDTLFIAPFYTPMKLPTPDLVTLSTYLDHLFPNLQDLTSFFEKSHHNNEPGISEASALASSLWIDVAQMVRSYQRLRKRIQSLFGK